MRSARRIPRVNLPAICLASTAALLHAFVAGAYPLAQAATGPLLELKVPPSVNGDTMSVPVVFTSNGHAISTIVFSIDYDGARVAIDPADGDEDGIPDAVVFKLPAGLMAMATLDAADADGELDVIVTGLKAPLPALRDGTLATLMLSPVKGGGQVNATSVRFAASPPPSFGSTAGQSVPGTVVDGSTPPTASAPPSGGPAAAGTTTTTAAASGGASASGSTLPAQSAPTIRPASEGAGAPAAPASPGVPGSGDGETAGSGGATGPNANPAPASADSGNAADSANTVPQGASSAGTAGVGDASPPLLGGTPALGNPPIVAQSGDATTASAPEMDPNAADAGAGATSPGASGEDAAGGGWSNGVVGLVALVLAIGAWLVYRGRSGAAWRGE